MASYLNSSMLTPILPWENDEVESSRFFRILLVLLIVSILFGAVVPFIDVVKPDRDRAASIPPRLVKMVLEKKKEVKPPPPVEQPKEEPIEEPKEEPKEEKKEEPKPEKQPEKVEPKNTAKEVAKKHIAVFDALADLRDPDDMQNLKENKSLANDTGQAAQVTRSVITKKATQGSGGIKVATASQSSGTGRLAGQNTTQVKSDIDEAVSNTQVKSASGALKRSSENIQLEFEKNKPAIFALYHRALRKDPSIQGRVSFRLTIQPDGRVSSCEIESSELNNPALEKRLVARIKRINFGAAQVATWNSTYVINFFPS
ncbi:AgmX/PglI C-terminal domain-containing protein [Aliikangiella sp. IMCC44653]